MIDLGIPSLAWKTADIGHQALYLRRQYRHRRRRSPLTTSVDSTSCHESCHDPACARAERSACRPTQHDARLTVYIQGLGTQKVFEKII
jgi:hypothetical protein